MGLLQCGHSCSTGLAAWVASNVPTLTHPPQYQRLDTNRNEEKDMSDGDKIWIAQNGERSGPFSEQDVRRWLTEGRYDAQTLVWRKGMAEWVPLFSLFPERAAPPATPPPPPRPDPAASAPSFAATDRPGTTHVLDEPTSAYREPSEPSRRMLPTPPSLHWGLVLLFSILTFGIFALVWPFIQANWVRKIDGDSKAMLLLGGGLACGLVGEVMSAGHRASALGGLLTLAYFVLWIVGYFAMAGSIRRTLADYDLPVEIGGITLFFFNTLYLQGQLSWIARWQNTGSSQPRAPKGVFWLLWVPVFFIAMLAAIAIPAYQNYVHRAQATQSGHSE